MISKPLSIAVTGGKGGTGKSTLARNLGIFFSQVGNRVMLLDFSDSFSSIHSLSGLPGWKVSSSDDIFQQKTRIDNFLSLHTPGVPERLASVYRFEKEEKRYDVLMCDVQPDRHPELLDIFLAADIPLAVVTPDLESILETFEFLSRLILALIERESEGRWTFEHLLLDLPVRERISHFISPEDIFSRSSDGQLKSFLKKILDELLIGVVVNAARGSEDFELGQEMENFARKVFSIPLVYVGAVEFDEKVIESTKTGRAAIMSHPDCKAAADIKQLGRRIISCPAIKLITPSWKLGMEGDETYYEILQVSFAAPAYEIKRSYEDLSRIFSGRSFFSRIVKRKEVLEDMAAFIHKAYATLDDKSERARYDRMLSGDLKIDIDESGRDRLEEEVEWAVKVGSGRGFDRKITGCFIKDTREKMGLSFQDIASATKIGTHYLRAIEEENYVDLPESIYVKGFLKEIARLLHLDPDQVVMSYLKRMKDGLREK